MRCTHPSWSRHVRQCSAQDSSVCASGLLLLEERLISDAVAVYGWRYESAEITYERKTLMVGGPLLFVLTGAASALRNRSARRAAEAQTALQWRPLGPLTVLPTTDRLLVWHRSAWWSVWYSSMEHATCDGSQLHLQFLHAAAPYLFVGDVRALTGAISSRELSSQAHDAPGAAP